MAPNSESGQAIQLKHLIIETCRHLNIFSSIFDQDFINKIYYMVISGAKITLKRASGSGYTIDITGVRVMLEIENGEKQFIPSLDPQSIATINIIDCNHKICGSVIIGQFDFSHVWNGQKSGEIFADEGINIMRQLIELAESIWIQHRFNEEVKSGI